jgi:mRNA-degrading endonuclease RelE of RelBE toxin-antitoxin system
MSESPLRGIELSRRATRDLRKLTPPDRRRVRDALEGLSGEAPNLDIKALASRPPWLRLRVGELRAIYRPETAAEPSWRVIHRRELDRAMRAAAAPYRFCRAPVRFMRSTMPT